jgi:hypothetical protein
MSRTILHASVVPVLTCCAFGQSPAFEVVSIKPDLSGPGHSNSENGMLTATNVSIIALQNPRVDLMVIDRVEKVPTEN